LPKAFADFTDAPVMPARLILPTHSRRMTLRASPMIRLLAFIATVCSHPDGMIAMMYDKRLTTMYPAMSDAPVMRGPALRPP
jgi:hypothetical protein